MKKIMFFLLCICSMSFVFSQKPISIERVINDLDWENCSESDVILAFKDNVVKKEIKRGNLGWCELCLLLF